MTKITKEVLRKIKYVGSTEYETQHIIEKEFKSYNEALEALSKDVKYDMDNNYIIHSISENSIILNLGKEYISYELSIEE